MAKIGSICLLIDGKLDSGFAQLLIKPPRNSHDLNHNGAILRVSPDSPFAVCISKGAKSHEDSLLIGNSILQECLDILSVTGEEDLATKDSTEEYIVWWKEGGIIVLSYCSTATLQFWINPVQVQVRDKNGNLIPTPVIKHSFHKAFRYFRLAQTSEDLFDSYRNMYLAFESFISSKYPKGRVREKDWLEDSLTQAESTLQLKRFVPTGTSSPAKYIYDTVYKNARIEIFHSIKQTNDTIRPSFVPTTIKQGGTGPNAGQVIYTPPRDTTVIQNRLENLIRLEKLAIIHVESSRKYLKSNL